MCHFLIYEKALGLLYTLLKGCSLLGTYISQLPFTEMDQPTTCLRMARSCLHKIASHGVVAPGHLVQLNIPLLLLIQTMQ